MQHLLVVLAFAVLCGLWVIWQRFVASRDAQIAPLKRSCGHCAKVCSEREESKTGHV